jgi:hypothetical protein
MKVIRLKGEQYTSFLKDPATRAELKKSFFDQHGPCVFQKPNGRILAVVRADPGVPEQGAEVDVTEAAPAEVVEERAEVSDEQMAAQARSIKRQKNSGQMKSVPSPKGCKCKDWPWRDGTAQPRDDRGKPTAHHPKCAFARMYERQKGSQVKTVVHGATLTPRIQRAVEPKETGTVKPSVVGRTASPTVKLGKEKPLDKIPHPDKCPKCKDFTKSKKMDQDQHHPTCVYFKKYKAITIARVSIGKPAHVPREDHAFLLFDVDDQEAKRPAEAAEIEEARRRLRDEGAAFVEVDGKDYLVMRADGEAIEPLEGKPAQETTGETVPELSDTEPPPADEEEEDPALEGEQIPAE